MDDEYAIDSHDISEMNSRDTQKAAHRCRPSACYWLDLSRDQPWWCVPWQRWTNGWKKLRLGPRGCLEDGLILEIRCGYDSGSGITLVLHRKIEYSDSWVVVIVLHTIYTLYLGLCGGHQTSAGPLIVAHGFRSGEVHQERPVSKWFLQSCHTFPE